MPSSVVLTKMKPFLEPTSRCQKVMWFALLACLVPLLIIETSGAVIICKRYIERKTMKPVAFPHTATVAVAQNGQPLKADVMPTFAQPETLKSDEPDVIVTGALSSFIWNMPGQRRSMAFLYGQKNLAPFDMSPNRIIVEFPEHLDFKSWTDRQGAWILRRTAEVKPVSHEPYFWTGVSVRRFIPLSEDRSRFDGSKTISFPISKGASQLIASGELKGPNGAISLKATPAAETAGRLRKIELKPSSGAARMIIELSSAKGTKRILEFFVHQADEHLPGGSNRSEPKMTFIIKSASGELSRDQHILNFKEQLRNYRIDVSDARITSVDIGFENLANDSTTSIYELTLTADDFQY